MDNLDVVVVAQDFALKPPALVWTLAHRASLGDCIFFGAPLVGRRQAPHRTGAWALVRAKRCGGRVLATFGYERPDLTCARSHRSLGPLALGPPPLHGCHCPPAVVPPVPLRRRSPAMLLQSEDGGQSLASGPQSLSCRAKPSQSGAHPMGHGEKGRSRGGVNERIEPKRPADFAKSDRQRRSDLSQNGYGLII